MRLSKAALASWACWAAQPCFLDLGLRERGGHRDIGPGLPLCEAPLAGLGCSSGCSLGDLLLNHELFGTIRALGVAGRKKSGRSRVSRRRKICWDATSSGSRAVGAASSAEIHSAIEPVEDEVHRHAPGLEISRAACGGPCCSGSLSDSCEALPMRPPSRDGGGGALGCTSGRTRGIRGARTRGVIARCRSRRWWGLSFGERRAVDDPAGTSRASGRDRGICASRTRGSSICCRPQRLRGLLRSMLCGELLCSGELLRGEHLDAGAAASSAAAGVGGSGAAAAEALASAAALALGSGPGQLARGDPGAGFGELGEAAGEATAGPLLELDTHRKSIGDSGSWDVYPFLLNQSVASGVRDAYHVCL